MKLPQQVRISRIRFGGTCSVAHDGSLFQFKHTTEADALVALARRQENPSEEGEFLAGQDWAWLAIQPGGPSQYSIAANFVVAPFLYVAAHVKKARRISRKGGGGRGRDVPIIIALNSIKRREVILKGLIGKVA